jgi:hypothetical protein
MESIVSMDGNVDEKDSNRQSDLSVETGVVSGNPFPVLKEAWPIYNASIPTFLTLLRRRDKAQLKRPTDLQWLKSTRAPP